MINHVTMNIKLVSIYWWYFPGFNRLPGCAY